MKKLLMRIMVCSLLLTCGCGVFVKSSLENTPQYPEWYCERSPIGEILLHTEMPRNEAMHIFKNLRGMEALAIDWWYMYSPIPEKPTWVNVYIIYSNYDIARESMSEYGIENICPCLEGRII